LWQNNYSENGSEEYRGGTKENGLPPKNQIVDQSTFLNNSYYYGILYPGVE